MAAIMDLFTYENAFGEKNFMWERFSHTNEKKKKIYIWKNS